VGVLVRGEAMLFVGDDWAEDHHDIEIVDERGSCRSAPPTWSNNVP
jgi:hypothetical protein